MIKKKGFTKYFSYEHTALVNKLLDKNTQDLRKGLNEIKQQKIKLNEDKRNSTNKKIKMTSLIMLLRVLLTELINFLSIYFCRVNKQMNQNYQNG